MTDEIATIVSVSKRSFLRSLLRNPKGATGLLIIAMMIVCAIFAATIAPHSHSRQVVGWRFAPPVWQEGGSATNLLGGDNLGRDILSRTIVGTRVSVQVALMVVSISLIVGTMLGAIAGYFGGIIDTAIVWLVDFQLAFPFLLLALLFMAVLGPGFGTLVIALAFALWIDFARVVRSETIRIRKLDFVDAATTMSVSKMRIIMTHILPNVLPAILVVATFDVALAIISEASLSFLRLGVQSPAVSWGAMISDGRNFLYDQPWIVIAPGLAVFISVLGVNLFGDFLRDYFDPRLERTRA